jgi:hypothetical protein
MKATKFYLQSIGMSASKLEVKMFENQFTKQQILTMAADRGFKK